MSLIIFLAILSMLSAMLIAESAENDGSRINIAGSLRMQSYKIAQQLLLHQMPSIIESKDLQTTLKKSSLAIAIKSFEQKLNQPVLRNYLENTSEPELNQSYVTVLREWKKIKFNLTLPIQITSLPQLLSDINHLVDTIDQLVTKLEIQTQGKLSLLRLIQSTTLFLTVFISFIALYEFTYNVVFPLRKLVDVAGDIRNKKFSVRVDHESDDELGLLSETFNNMSADLAKGYELLQQQVKQKTQKLKQANDALEILYQSARELTNDPGNTSLLEHFIQQLQQTLNLDSLVIRLSGEKQHALIGHSLNPDEDNDILIAEDDTADKMTSNPATPQAKNCKIFPIIMGDKQFGQIELQQKYAPDESQDWHSHVLSSMADNIAMAFGLERKTEQEHRLILMDERTVIARELHDSLAQSLSYLKIQIALLQKQLNKNYSREKLAITIIDIREGVSSAYQQLRELLTTFRLKLDLKGLHSALKDTAEEYQEKIKIPVNLSYNLQQIHFTPNEEIHVLQIIREALSNVARHAEATSASISCQLTTEEHTVEFIVSDNGIGLEAATPGNHYGITIMQERTQSLHGKLTIENNPSAGVAVSLRFSPSNLSNQPLL